MIEEQEKNVCGSIPLSDYRAARDRMERDWGKANFSRLVVDLIAEYANEVKTAVPRSTISSDPEWELFKSTGDPAVVKEVLSLVKHHAKTHAQASKVIALKKAAK